MLKRLIEVALPLKEVSEQSLNDPKASSGHPATMHVWWARRPLAACRAIVFASLIPDPDDPECPTSFKQLVMDLLGSSQFRPTQPEPSPGAVAPVETKPLEDTPRNRCLEFIKYLVRWENSNDPDYIEPARKLIKAAHKILHPDSDSEVPKVLDPFAGGGAIPLEALRLGCEAHAIDINPVAHLIQLCTLVYPQKFGRPLPADAPVPDYIQEKPELFVDKKSKGKGKGLFGDDAVTVAKAEYRRNPLAADVRYWANWVLREAVLRLGDLYPCDASGRQVFAYIWARTAQCLNPSCRAEIPLLSQLWLCKKKNRKVALRIDIDKSSRGVAFSISEGTSLDFDPPQGTLHNGQGQCPICGTVIDNKSLRAAGMADTLGERIVAVVHNDFSSRRKIYSAPSDNDLAAFRKAVQLLADAEASGAQPLKPTEPVPPDRPSPNSRGLSGLVRYGFTKFGDLLNPRQAWAMHTLSSLVRETIKQVSVKHQDKQYAEAVSSCLALALSRLLSRSNNMCVWHHGSEGVEKSFAMQAIPMQWRYAEGNPLTSNTVAGFYPNAESVAAAVEWTSSIEAAADVRRADAKKLPYDALSIDAILTDPPYYDSIPYADLSDFYYVLLKRVFGETVDSFRTPLTPKSQEMIAYYGPGKRVVQKPPSWYENSIRHALDECGRCLKADGVASVMFAHKTTTAWETILGALISSGFLVTGSWPIHTEMGTRMVARDAAALASSVTFVCRRRDSGAGEGLWDDVRGELRNVTDERLDFFWEQGIRGADFFISAIGPALSVFGRHERVVRLSGDEVTVGQFLDEVRDLVTHYALSKIVKGGQLGHIDAESQFYVVWRWSYGSAKVPADEAFKLAQALGFDTEMMWDKTGVLEKAGQNVLAMPIDKRMKIKNLGEPKADGAPASLIDVLHRLCAFRDKGDATGAGEFLARSGHGRSESLWLVAQAISEILPDGDKEKQLLQGLLNQRDALQSGSAKLF